MLTPNRNCTAMSKTALESDVTNQKAMTINRHANMNPIGTISGSVAAVQINNQGFDTMSSACNKD